MSTPVGPLGGQDIVVIGASAGGLEPLTQIVRGVPLDLAAAIFVVVHGSHSHTLADLLGRAGPLPAALATDGESIENGRIYVAQPDRHLLLEPGRVRTVRGPKEHRFRPAIDPLFRSAARAYGPRVVGVILSGALDDGTEGLSLIKQFAGKAIVQDPDEAFIPSMPASACRNVEVDYVFPCAEIAALLATLSRKPASPRECSERCETHRSSRPRLI